MRTPTTLATAATAIALLAGCGSSGSSTSSSSGAAAATQAASPSGYSRYGSSAPASTASTTAAAATTTGGSGAGVTVLVKHVKLGTLLAAGPQMMTVYLFEGDKGGSSACSGACAQAWPPVTTTAAATAGAGASASMLATITRSDGTKQVTYNGHPLYYFIQDKAPADTTGQGAKAFGADWYVLLPSGKKLDGS